MNFKGEKGDTAQQVPNVQTNSINKSSLTTRLLSAFVLAPPVLAAVYYGSPYFDILVLVAALIMFWEWRGMGGFAPGRGAWAVGGCVYIILPCLALVSLRNDPQMGLQTVFWLFTLVWAADSGAYAFGRMIGGPKLAPSISPKKTWAGFFGGTLCAGLIGFAAAQYLSKDSVAPLIFASMFLSVFSQGGDLLESWVKRRFNVKDTSNIIPGHGGVFDRVDGLLAAALAAAFFNLIHNNGFLLWL